MKRESTGGHAFLVASGILLSRLVGLVRQHYVSRYLGLAHAAADAWNQSFRIPNFLQNMFGEGVLSASFIPVYSQLLAQGDEEAAGKVAGATGSILALVISIIVLFGVAATPLFIDALATGFKGEERQLAIHIVRILFPGAGLLVLSAWCLGVLNSHRKFFLSYIAPVMWNAVMVATLLTYGGRSEESRLVILLAWASVIGSALQFGAQLPVALSLVRHLRLNLDVRSPHIREVIRNFVPVFISRGVVQISAFVDGELATFLPLGAVTGLQNAQLLFTLPVSLFGMAVSAAELPAMSSALGTAEEVAAYLRRRLNSGLKQIAFFIVPSAMAFLTLGDVVAGAIFQSGMFTAADSRYVWTIVAGAAVGLLASTLGRLYSSTYYALRDTRTPLRFAVVRVALTTVLGFLFAMPLPHLLGIPAKYGVAGLTSSAGIAGWVEFTLLRRTLNRRIGTTGLHATFVARLWTAAAIGAAAAWGVKLATLHVVLPHRAQLIAVPILGTYGLVYFGAAYLLGVEESVGVLRRLKR